MSDMVQDDDSGHIRQWHASHVHYIIPRPELASSTGWHTREIAKLAFSKTINTVADLKTTEPGTNAADGRIIFEARWR